MKKSLWPQLTGLFKAMDMEDFATQFPKLRLKIPKIPELENDDQENIINIVHSLVGEGTFGPYGSTNKLSPHLALNIVCN
jgi:hypothetical protein